MAKCEHILGMLNDYSHTTLATFEMIKSDAEYGCYKLEDYCDRRKTTNLTHFNFCPFCGTEIDWQRIRKKIKNENRIK